MRDAKEAKADAALADAEAAAGRARREEARLAGTPALRAEAAHWARLATSEAPFLAGLYPDRDAALRGAADALRAASRTASAEARGAVCLRGVALGLLAMSLPEGGAE